jgi:hypothetical protein
MTSSSTNALLMAGSVMLVAAGLTQLLPGGQRQLRGGGATDLDENEDEFITEELVVKIFDRLFIEMQMVMQQLSQKVQQVQMAGQQFHEAQLRKLFTQEFERALMAKQAQVYEDHDVDAECLEEATWEFLSMEDQHPKVKQAVERFQKLYESISGEQVVGRRPGVQVEAKEIVLLSASDTVDAATVYFGALNDTMRKIATNYRDQGKDLQDPKVMHELQMEFSSQANDAGEAALDARGVAMKDFQASIEKHSSDPKVARSLALLQMQQQKEMMEMAQATN